MAAIVAHTVVAGGVAHTAVAAFDVHMAVAVEQVWLIWQYQASTCGRYVTRPCVWANYSCSFWASFEPLIKNIMLGRPSQ